MTTTLKCVDCHRRRKVSLEDREYMRQQAKENGCSVGIICPGCLVKAYADEANYAYSISDGEMLLDHIRADPPWRILYLPTFWQH